MQDAEIFELDDPSRNGKQRSSSVAKDVDDSKSSSDEKEKPRSSSVGKEESGGAKPKRELPCRISVKVGGVEAFVYNRSPVYDFVMDQTKKHTKSPPASSGSDEKVVVKQFAAEIRAWRKPEPYKGKGIFVNDETIRLKAKKIK